MKTGFCYKSQLQNEMDMSLCESFIQVKIKLRHQAKEYYFSPSCESGWQHNIGYGVYVVMS